LLRWAILFLVVAIIAAMFGFYRLVGEAAWIAKILLVAFVIPFVVA
jgi:uncharacterized membrane protein YtjA (UPF0391 family)